MSDEQTIACDVVELQRERFGGINGEVVSVSKYPITTDGAANVIGDIEIARNLLGGENKIEVRARLLKDPEWEDLVREDYTGYDWTSGKGPKGIDITAGTTAAVRVTIEERAPITLVLPFLKDMFGL